jgi:chemosensory pili system protein ChpA (sensor histidine kinase/response regulator)
MVNKKTILVVEDSPTQAVQIRALLVANGLHVEIAGDGIEGLERANEVMPDLIILDLEMPRMNGIEMAHELKKNSRTCKIPLIMFTRHDNPEAMAMGLGEGIVDFIPKDAFAKVVMVETLKQMGIINRSPAR